MNSLALEAMQRASLRSRRRNLDDILVHMQALADCEYEGDLQAHVLEIFYTLTEEEQRIILRRSLVLQWERMLDESKEELSRTSGFIHEEDETPHLQAHREPDFKGQPKKTAEEEEAAKHADKVRGWKDIAVRTILILLIFAMVSMLFSTVFLDKNASFKGVFSILDAFIGLL